MVVAVPVREKVEAKTPVEMLIERITDSIGQEAADLRIQLGRRVVQGTLSSGEQRQELTEEQARIIAEALQNSAADGLDPTVYAKKVPDIQISVGSEVLFRQERYGNVSINNLQLEQQIPSVPSSLVHQVEQIDSLNDNHLTEAVPIEATRQAPVELSIEPPVSESATAAAIAAAELKGDGLIQASVEANEIADSLSGLVNPLGDKKLQPSKTGLGAYTITVENSNATVSKGSEVLLQITDGNVIQSSLNRDDAKALQVLVQSSSEPQSWTVPVQAANPNLVDAEIPPAIKIAQEQVEALPEGRTKKFLRKIGADLATQAVNLVQSVRRGLESEEFNAVREKVSAAVQAAPEKSVEGLGRGLEILGRGIAAAPEEIQKAATVIRAASEYSAQQVGGGIEKSGQWLASRPEAIREQRAARTALSLFQQGFKRTQERSYEQGGFKVAFEGSQQFSLSNAETGKALMRFQLEESSLGKSGVRVTEKDMSLEQYQALDAVEKKAEPVRGSAAAESHHVQKSEQVAQFCTAIAAAMESADCKTKYYRIQSQEDSLKISDLKSGREVYRQEGSQIESHLEKKDFDRFTQALQTLSPSVQQATVSQLHQAEIG